MKKPKAVKGYQVGWNGHTNLLSHVYFAKESLLMGLALSKDGIYEVEIRFVRWVTKPKGKK